MPTYSDYQRFQDRDNSNYADPNQPNYRPEWWRVSVAHWNKTLDWTLDLGDFAFKDYYLTNVPGEFTEDRVARLQSLSPEPFFKEAVQDHASLFCQFELSENAPSSLVENQDNVDLEGSSLSQWSIDPLTFLFRDGGCLLGCDINRNVTVGDRRPRLIKVPMRDVYWPEYREYDGVNKLSRISIRRTFNAQDSSGNLVIRDRYYVYQLDDNMRCFLTVWSENENHKLIEGDPVALVDASSQPLTRIPFTDKLSMISNLNIDQDRKMLSVFAAILELNIEHYNARSELRAVEQKSALPTPIRYWANGVPSPLPKFYAGSGKSQDYAAGSKVEYLELQGDSIPELRQSIKDLEQKTQRRDNKMFHTGSAMTATEADIENQKAKVSLPKIKEIIESAYQDLFAIWELLANPSPADDIGGIMIDAAVIESPAQTSDIQYYMQMIDRGIPVDAVINAMLREGLLKPEDFENDRGFVATTESLPADPNEEII